MKIQATGDGSETLLNEELDETYHSRKGALTESLHVFIKEGLLYAVKNGIKSPLKILEVGFGTGLNAFLTVKEKIPVQYHTLEPFPVALHVIRQLNSALDTSDKEELINLHTAEWSRMVEIKNHFHFVKYQQKLEEINFEDSFFDLVYFDAFGPQAQPAMWSKAIFSRLTPWVKKNGILVTYSSQGQFRRNLTSCGWKIDKIPGPPGKREIVRATKINM